jgi:hypothetical protein
MRERRQTSRRRWGGSGSGRVSRATGRLATPAACLAIVLLAALALPLAAPSLAQGGALVPYRQLTWDDFPVNDSVASELDATTMARIGYNYQLRLARSGALFIASVRAIQIRSGLDRAASWRKSHMKRDPAAVLAHEQGHFDLNEIRAAQLRQLKPDSYPAGMGASPQAAAEDLRARLKTFFDAQIAAAQREHDRYDQETEHGRRAEAQKRWLDTIKQDRERLGIHP